MTNNQVRDIKFLWEERGTTPFNLDTIDPTLSALVSDYLAAEARVTEYITALEESEDDQA
jgi:hypothetical protein